MNPVFWLDEWLNLREGTQQSRVLLDGRWADQGVSRSLWNQYVLWNVRKLPLFDCTFRLGKCGPYLHKNQNTGTTIFTILCGCEIWFLTLRDNSKLWVFGEKCVDNIWTQVRRSIKSTDKITHRMSQIVFRLKIIGVIKSRAGDVACMGNKKYL